MNHTKRLTRSRILRMRQKRQRQRQRQSHSNGNQQNRSNRQTKKCTTFLKFLNDLFLELKKDQITDITNFDSNKQDFLTSGCKKIMTDSLFDLFIVFGSDIMINNEIPTNINKLIELMKKSCGY